MLRYVGQGLSWVGPSQFSLRMSLSDGRRQSVPVGWLTWARETDSKDWLESSGEKQKKKKETETKKKKKKGHQKEGRAHALARSPSTRRIKTGSVGRTGAASNRVTVAPFDLIQWSDDDNGSTPC